MLPIEDLEKKLRQEDLVELPMDEKFYEVLHNKIMASIDKTEVKPLSRLAKTWVFLETKTKPHKALAKKVIKTGFVGLTLTLALGLAGLSAQNASSQIRIIQEAKKNPTQCSDLVVSYQEEKIFMLTS